MTDAELEAFIASVVAPGWCCTVEYADRHRFVRVRAAGTIIDTYFPERTTDALNEQFVVPDTWRRDALVNRLFATIQFLADHELRETFTVAGVRPFDPHEPVSVTGEQHDWFVERQAALRGY